MPGEFLPLSRVCSFRNDFIFPDEVIEAINRDIPSDAGEQMTGYRFAATGLRGYSLYHEKEELCTVYSLVIASPPVVITGYDMKWQSILTMRRRLFRDSPASLKIVKGIKSIRLFIWNEANTKLMMRLPYIVQPMRMHFIAVIN